MCYQWKIIGFPQLNWIWEISKKLVYWTCGTLHEGIRNGFSIALFLGDGSIPLMKGSRCIFIEPLKVKVICRVSVNRTEDLALHGYINCSYDVSYWYLIVLFHYLMPKRDREYHNDLLLDLFWKSFLYKMP